MHKPSVLVLAIAFAVSVHSANAPAWMDVPKDIQILRLPWISKSMTQALCTDRYPELAAKYSSTLSAHQAEVRKAEAMVKRDAAEQGADGQRYLAAYMKEAQRIIEQTYRDATNFPKPTEMECQSLLGTAAQADNLFSMWRFFARQIEEQEDSEARAQQGAR